MRTKRFTAVVAAGPGGRAVIVVPFDPDGAWGAKAEHHVNGTLAGQRIRVQLAPGGDGWGFDFGPARAQQLGLEPGDEVAVELTPEGPQRADLAEDIAAALAANPAAGAFFDTRPVLPQGVPALDRRDHSPAGRARAAHRRGGGPLGGRRQGAAAPISVTSGGRPRARRHAGSRGGPRWLTRRTPG